MTATLTAGTTVAIPPSGPAADRDHTRSTVFGTGAASVEELLRRQAVLPVGHPGRAALRARSIEAYLPLARSLAARYRGRGEPFDDLFQVASLALVRAVDGYDPARAVGFLSYAVPTIVGSLKRHFRDTTWQVRVPRRIQELAIGSGPARGLLAQQLGRVPTLTELAAHLGAAEGDMAAAVDSWHFRHPESLDSLSTTDADDRRPFGDTVGALDVGFNEVIDWHTLQPLLAALPVRERRILGMRFFGDLTQSEIAAQVGLSQMHISRLLARVLMKLRIGMLDGGQGPRPGPVMRPTDRLGE